MKIEKIKNLWNKGFSYSHQKLISNVIPKISNIEATNACGMKCIMCPRQNMTRKIGFMDIKLFEKIIRQAEKGSKVALHFFGDPLLHPKIGEMIKICRKYEIKSSLSTNPTSLTKENIQKILDSGLDYLHISLDGATKQTYEKIRRGMANYKQAIEYIENFLSEKIKRKTRKPITTIAIIRMKETEKEINDFLNQWKNKPGIDKVDVKDFIAWGGGIDTINQLASEFSRHYKRREYYPCFWPWSKICVLWDGRVVPCCSDFDGKYILGDLKKQTLKEIWNSRKIQILRRQCRDNDFPKNHLCYGCREREGFKPSRFFPLNLITQKRFKIFSYFKFN